MDRARHPSESEESRAAVEAWGAGCREDEELDGGRKERLGQVARCIYRAVWLGHMMKRKLQ